MIFLKLLNGGPAFPCEPTETRGSVDGISVRDYFAAAALAGFRADAAPWRTGMSPAYVAAECYADADAMLAERDKKP